jgi:hypothetical protein
MPVMITPVKTTYEMIVILQDIPNNIRCRIVENIIPENQSQFYYEVEFLPSQDTEFYQQEVLYFDTKGGAFSEMTKYLAVLKEPLHQNPNY